MHYSKKLLATNATNSKEGTKNLVGFSVLEPFEKRIIYKKYLPPKHNSTKEGTKTLVIFGKKMCLMCPQICGIDDEYINYFRPVCQFY